MSDVEKSRAKITGKSPQMWRKHPRQAGHYSWIICSDSRSYHWLACKKNDEYTYGALLTPTPVKNDKNMNWIERTIVWWAHPSVTRTLVVESKIPYLAASVGYRNCLKQREILEIMSNTDILSKSHTQLCVCVVSTWFSVWKVAISVTCLCYCQFL